MTDVILTIRRLGALDGRSPCAPPMRWRHPRKPMARIYRRRGAATFVNAARDRGRLRAWRQYAARTYRASRPEPGEPRSMTILRPFVWSFLLIKKILTMQHKNERIGGVDLDWRNHMPILISSYPSPTAIVSRCPQCRAVSNISLIEPDLEPLKERHTFACEACGSSYIHLIDRAA
jgi:hypothetical protein